MRSAPIAIIPAAGHGSRLGGLPHSKELVCVGADERPVIVDLIQRLALGGIGTAKIITRPDKTDIEATLGAVSHGVNLDYVHTAATPSSVHTIAVALREHIDHDCWVLGFPDILIEPRDTFRALVRSFHESEADITLGLFRSDRPDKADMVELDASGRVSALRIKQPNCQLQETWAIACWGKRFTALLLEAVAACDQRADALLGLGTGTTELFVGNVINTAIDQGFSIETVPFTEGWALDIGTADDLERSKSLLK